MGYTAFYVSEKNQLKVIACRNTFTDIGEGSVYKYYLKNGGLIKDKERYCAILKAVSVEIINEILTKGSRLEIPFFGEMYIEEQKTISTRNNKVKKNNYFIPTLVFKTILQGNYFMKMYSTLHIFDLNTFFRYRKDDKLKQYNKKKITDSAVIYNVTRAKKKQKVYYYKRLIKKKL